MAKSRQQRKAEQRARQARGEESVAQRETQVPVSGEVAQAEAAIEGATPPPAPETPAKAERRPKPERKAEKPPRGRDRQSKTPAKRAPAAAEPRRRGRVLGFFVSCWHELKRVQWPDRETLVQASAVTLIFVAIAAVYLGALDYVFNKLVQAIL